MTKIITSKDVHLYYGKKKPSTALTWISKNTKSLH